MERTAISAFREIHDPQKIIENPSEFRYVKPTWILNDNVYDTTWKVTTVGLDVDYSKDLNLAKKISFSRPVSDNSLLTDFYNRQLLRDIQNSLLYLNTKGQITRPRRISEILVTACHLIRHANEMNSKCDSPKIRLLSEIRFEHLKSYLLDFQLTEKIFYEIVDHILEKYKTRNDIVWGDIKSELKLSTRTLYTAKSKVIGFLEERFEGFEPCQKYNKQHQDACKNFINLEEHLLPSEKTISNEISKIEALFTARQSQVYKFQHSPIKLFSGGWSIFEKMLSPQKTPLIPAHVCLHTIASALAFCRKYGEALREYFYDFASAEKRLIKLIGLREYAKSLSKVQQELFETTTLPSMLEELKASCYSLTEPDSRRESNNHTFLYQATRLYTAAVFILLATFTSARISSLLGLPRGCFVHSPMDGLFDIILRIPKSSERWQLEEVHRPIPNIIYDYGLEFASFNSQVEDRRGCYSEDFESFLFSRSITSRSLTTSIYTGTDEGTVHLEPLSDDTMYAYLCEFSDWSQSPLINGKRWYVRPHQFRRFFAVLYFNFTRDSGLEELSWFMGHADLDQTFHYAEVSPTDEWIDEAEATIAKIASSADSPINADENIQKIVDKARESSSVITVIEPLVRKLIEDHKAKTNQHVRFFKIDGDDVFFYFTNPEEEH